MAPHSTSCRCIQFYRASGSCSGLYHSSHQQYHGQTNIYMTTLGCLFLLFGHYAGVLDYGPSSVPTLPYRDNKKSPLELQFEFCIETQKLDGEPELCDITT
jgi:hypothetical protein